MVVVVALRWGLLEGSEGKDAHCLGGHSGGTLEGEVNSVLNTTVGTALPLWRAVAPKVPSWPAILPFNFYTTHYD